MSHRFPYSRLVIIGATGSGKSTLAARVAETLALNYIELDALHWGQNWTPAKEDVFFARVEKETRSPNWVVAGNYSAVRPITWRRADAVVWLDYSFHIVFWRLFTRTIRRAVTQEELWNGNCEKFWWHLKLWSEESLFHWLFKTYWRRKREYPQLLAQPEHQHLELFHFRNPVETDRWLESLS